MGFDVNSDASSDVSKSRFRGKRLIVFGVSASVFLDSLYKASLLGHRNLTVPLAEGWPGGYPPGPPLWFLEDVWRDREKIRNH